MNVSETSEFKRLIQRHPNIRHLIGDYLNVRSFNEMEKTLEVFRFFGRYVQLLIRYGHSGHRDLARLPLLNETMEEKRTRYQELMCVLSFGESIDDIYDELLLWMPLCYNSAVGITYMYYLALFDDKQYRYGKKVETKLICHPSIEPYYADFYMIKCRACLEYSCHCSNRTYRRYGSGDPYYR